MEGEEPHKICLIPEFCYVMGLTDAQRADFRVMKDVAEYTRHTPVARRDIMANLFKQIKAQPEAIQILESWGLELSSKNTGLELQGRLIKSPTLNFGGGAKEVVWKGDWDRATKNNKAFKAENLTNWTLVYPFNEQHTAKRFIIQLMSFGSKMGMIMNKPNEVAILNDRTDAYLKAIKEMPEGQQLVRLKCLHL